MPDKNLKTIAPTVILVGVTINWQKNYRLSCIFSSNVIVVAPNFVETYILGSAISVSSFMEINARDGCFQAHLRIIWLT